MFDPAMFAGMSSLVGSFFPSPEQQGSLTAEQRTFLAHFQEAFSKLVADHAKATGEPMPFPTAFNPALLLPGLHQDRPASASGEAAAALGVKAEPVPATGGGTDTAAAPAEAGDAPEAMATDTPAALEQGAAAAAAPSEAQQRALHLGQLMFSLAGAYPGIGAALSSLIAAAQAGGGLAGVGQKQVQELQSALALPMAPLVAAQAMFVQSTLGEVLAARVEATVPKGSPFASGAEPEGEHRLPHPHTPYRRLPPAGLLLECQQQRQHAQSHFLPLASATALTRPLLFSITGCSCATAAWHPRQAPGRGQRPGDSDPCVQPHLAAYAEWATRGGRGGEGEQRPSLPGPGCRGQLGCGGCLPSSLIFFLAALGRRTCHKLAATSCPSAGVRVAFYSGGAAFIVT